MSAVRGEEIEEEHWYSDGSGPSHHWSFLFIICWRFLNINIIFSMTKSLSWVSKATFIPQVLKLNSDFLLRSYFLFVCSRYLFKMAYIRFQFWTNPHGQKYNNNTRFTTGGIFAVLSFRQEMNCLDFEYRQSCESQCQIDNLIQSFRSWEAPWSEATASQRLPWPLACRSASHA